jgi:ABC-type dipeptide/oligopeptide/nickel transport system permease subunit
VSVLAAKAPGATLPRLRRRWLGLLGLGITLITVASAVFAPWVAPYDPLA